MPSTKRQPLKKKPPTPIRSPMPMQRGGRRGGGAGRQNTLPSSTAHAAMTTSSKSPKAASSSEKETPTVVLTAMTKNISPFNLSTNCDDENPSSSSAKAKIDTNDDAKEGRIAVMERGYDHRDSTQRSAHSPVKKLHHDWRDEESLEGEDVAVMKKIFRDEFSEGEASSGEEEDTCLDDMFDNEKVVNAIQHLLQSGIASICRLRKLFPASFFAKFDLESTSVTQFNVQFIEEALRRSVEGYSNDEDECGYSGDDALEERSMMKSISTKKSATQKTLSPLTGASQWLSQYDTEASQQSANPAAPPNFGGDEDALKKWQKQAMEALTLVQWMGNTTKFLSEGKLARVDFGICHGNELIESYSFQLSFAEQSQAGGLQLTQLRDSTGVFFRNLNGFSVGSGTLLPSKTQSSFASQGFTQASSQYFTQTQQHVAMSQKHHSSQSVGLTQQRKLLMSMSQSVRSIRASAKNNDICQIPDSRYLSLDVKFTDELPVNDLPDIFQEQEGDTTSPFPSEDNMADHFVVTPIGTISESDLAGIKVDLHAYNKNNVHKEDVDEDKSVYFSQHRQDPEYGTESSTSSNSETSDLGDSDSLAYAIPKGLAEENVYLPCKFLGHRQSTEVNGNGKEEFKLKFDDELLTSKGMKKQWILAKNVLSSTEMHAKIKQAILERRGNKVWRDKENIATIDMKSIAEAVNVQEDIVKYVAEKAKRKKRGVSNVTRNDKGQKKQKE